MTATILRADARHLPLADGSVDLIVTSPPYYALRSYTDGGEHYDGQIGAEPTPAEYIDSLIACTREWMRVLKPGGSMWINLGDKYVADNRGSGGDKKRGEAKYAPAGRMGYVGEGIMPRKSLMLLPERYAIRCVDDLGLILRRDQIWSKPNPMPESVTDRTRSSHEYWFHLVKQPRYFAAVDEIREESVPQRGLAGTFKRPKPSHTLVPGQAATQHRADRADKPAYNPLGALPGSVWEIPTEPLIIPDHIAHARCCGGKKRPGCEDGLDHYAAFPTEWPRRIILGWSPVGICTACGEGRQPVTESERQHNGVPVTGALYGNQGKVGTATGRRHAERTIRTSIGYACACPDTSAPTRPAVVLDPFSGTGTTVLVAKALGRHGIGSDRSADYCRLATWRTTDSGELAKAMRVPKPPKPLDGQGDLFAFASDEGAA